MFLDLSLPCEGCVLVLMWSISRSLVIFSSFWKADLLGAWGRRLDLFYVSSLGLTTTLAVWFY
uniref:Uncharacterized protein n=1 Tax=Manihot esculenta TaxID=3983 RepID=A0A251K9X5_MANES